jgi:hypothetical protein
MRIVVATLLAAAAMAGAASVAAKDADAPAMGALDCAYAPKGGGEVESFKACAVRSASGALHLKRRHLHSLTFDRYGLASLRLGDSFYYASRAGRFASVMTMDNWADDFADGLARSPRAGKVGYIDRTLRLVIAARYEGALPFAHGRAAVCIGCRPQRTDEHQDYVGGRWGCIDVTGREVVALTRSSLAC